uniref:Uncharacterized protein n=1 Tax=Rhizophora mucronata TaxID=61149 RepID=A0A2P2Q536_RHIMU
MRMVVVLLIAVPESMVMLVTICRCISYGLAKILSEQTLHNLTNGEWRHLTWRILHRRLRSNHNANRVPR